MDGIHQLEILWIWFVQAWGAWLAQPMRLISLIGSEEFFLIFMPIIYWSIDSALGIRVAMILLFSNGLNASLKLIFHGPRPYWLDQRIQAFSSESSFGFPSNHAQTAAGVWGFLAARLGDRVGKILLALLVFLIGFSRIYLGMHFFSDVVAGWLVGCLLVWVFIRFEKPVTAWLRKLTFIQQLLAALVSALFLAGIILVPAAALKYWTIPLEWVANAAKAAPQGQIDPFNLDGAFTTAGTWFGMMAGVAWLYHRQGGYKVNGAPLQRLLAYLVGLVGVLILWYGVGKIFPRDASLLSYTLRFARYTMIGLWVSALAPVVFQKLKISSQ